MITYQVINHVLVVDDPRVVDDVEIETRTEREQREWFAKNFAARINAQFERELKAAFFGVPLDRLPKP